MGCGCQGKGSTIRSTPNTRRVTVYQVLNSGSVVSEFETLPAARKEAVAVGGRVKVTTKVV